MISTKLGEVALSRHGHGELHDLAGFVASNGERCAWLSKDTSDIGRKTSTGTAPGSLSRQRLLPPIPVPRHRRDGGNLAIPLSWLRFADHLDARSWSSLLAVPAGRKYGRRVG